MVTVSPYVIWVMKGATFVLTPATQPLFALLCPQRLERRHWLSRVQHCAAICGLRMRVLAPGTSVTERTLSIPGLRQKVMAPSSPPSMTITPPAGMRTSTAPGGGEAEPAGGDGGGDGGSGGGGGDDVPHVMTAPAAQTLLPAAGRRHSRFWLVSALSVT